MLINILTRTHNRPKHFNVCRNSIINQTYKNINHIVGSDISCNYFNTIKLTPRESSPLPDNYGIYKAPWNLYFNELHNEVKDGWIMYLDDDDMFTSSESLSMIVKNITDENELVLWRVSINGLIIPEHEYYGKIYPGHISGIGVMFHSKHLPVDWGSWNFGDYRVINELSKKLNQKWINKILTQTQGRPNHGQIPID